MNTTVTSSKILGSLKDKILGLEATLFGRSDKVRLLRAQLKDAEHEYDTARYSHSILTGVLTGWKEPDPGKDKPAYCFVEGSEQAVAVKELLTPEELLQAAERHVRVLPFESVQTGSCPECVPEKKLPLIQKYEQIKDVLDGDMWAKSYFVVCPDCNAVYQIGKIDYNEHRF